MPRSCILTGLRSPSIHLDEDSQNMLLKLKQQGNDKFRAGDFEGARHLYSEALDKITSLESEKKLEIRNCEPLLELKTALLNNRGLMHLKLKSYFAAIRDFTNCITFCRMPSSEAKRPSYFIGRYLCTVPSESKALYRRSLVYRAIGNVPSAVRDVHVIIGMTGDVFISEKDLPAGMMELAKKDFLELSNHKRSIEHVPPHDEKNDSRLNYFGAEWKLLWRDPRPKNQVQGRQGHTVVYYNNALYVLAGNNVNHMPVIKFEMFDLRSKTWTYRLRVPPSIDHLCDHTAVVWRDCMYVYGGDYHTNDIWQYNFKNKFWKKFIVKGRVPNLSEHTACVIGDTMYVFGGTGQLNGRDIEHSNNLYSLHFPTKRWHKITGTDDRNPFMEGINLPEPRYNHVMWPDASRNRIYIMGGSMRRPNYSDDPNDLWNMFCYEYNNTTLKDLWYFDLDQKVWVQEQMYGNAPVPRCEYSAAVTSRGAVMMGGFTNSVFTSYFKEDCEVLDKPTAYSQSTYLSDTFEFISSSDSFCVIQTPVNGSISKRAKCVLVSDGDDHIYAVHGYHGGFEPYIQGFSDIHVLNLKETHSANPKTPLKACSSCSKTNNEEKLKKCNGICGGKAWYCSSVCQKQHWREHKQICGKKKE